MPEFEDNQNGILYTKGYETLYSVSRRESIVIDSRCKTIKGEDENGNPAFYDCRDSLKSFSFQESPQLQTIGRYAFYGCTALEQIDLLTCTSLTTIDVFAFSECSAVTSINLPSSVVTLGEESFSYVSKVQSLQLPASISTIGNTCFGWCSMLNTVTFKDGINIQYFPHRSFARTNISSIQIPENLSSIKPSCFEETPIQTITVHQNNSHFKVVDNVLLSFDGSIVYYVSYGRTSIDFPENITKISDSACAFNPSLTISFPATLQEIDSYAINNARQLQNVTIPKNVSRIGQYAFNGCSSLVLIIFEECIQIEKLENNAFAWCSNLTSIELPNSITSIGDSCFASCSSLQFIILPKNITYIGGGVLQGCPSNINLTLNPDSDYYIDQNMIISKNNKTISQLIIDRDNVTLPPGIETILGSAFYGKTQLTTIYLSTPETLKYIGNRAFQSCTGFSTFNPAPTAVETIGEYCFSHCDSLISLYFPNVSDIANNAFEYCSGLINITLSTVHNIGNEAFINCISLSLVNLGNDLLSLGDKCFSSTIQLKQLELPPSLQTIGRYAFYQSGIETIEFKSTEVQNTGRIQSESQMTEVGPYAFANATRLKDLLNIPQRIENISTGAFSRTAIIKFELPLGTKTLGSSAFAYCESLTLFIIPQDSQLESILPDAFIGCKNLTNITGSSTNYKVINNALFKSDETELVLFPPCSPAKVFAVPENVKTIGYYALSGCENLIHIIIPEFKVFTKIGEHAFENCINLRSINLPSTITEIGTDAFLGCKNLGCDLIVEINDELKTKLVNDAKFPKKSLMSCVQTIPVNCYRTYQHYILAYIFITSS